MGGPPDRRRKLSLRRIEAGERDPHGPFVTLYRWDVEEAQKGEFRLAWNVAMLALRKQTGAAASVLAAASDGTLIATILWPNEKIEALATRDTGAFRKLLSTSMAQERFAFPARSRLELSR